MRPGALIPVLLILLFGFAEGTRASEKYDGNWSIFIFGAPGHCQFGYRMKMTIDNGNVLYRGRQVSPHAINVSSGGAVTLRLGTGKFTVIGSGEIDDRRGQGRWTAAGFRCTGWWRAVRQ
ncbi:MAG TPA: hypothetical protein VFK86_02185 [Bauldia sp.]|nr:hypothetical protein [Bauldia sp.]